MNSQNYRDFRTPVRRVVEFPQPAPSLSTPSRTVSSDALFDGLYEIGISHGDSLYRLKITRQGKLILNK